MSHLTHVSHNPHHTVPIPPSGGGGPADGFIFASSDFESGVYNPPFQLSSVQGSVGVSNDPTPRATGKVADFHYQTFPSGGNFDCNTALSPVNNPNLGLGQGLVFHGDFYLDTDGSSPTSGTVRKLNYWGWSNDTWGFQHQFNLIVTLFNTVLPPIPAGSPLQIAVATSVTAADGTPQFHGMFAPTVPTAGDSGTLYGPANITLQAWHTLDIILKINSGFAIRDGIFKLTLDGVVSYDFTDMLMTSPTWIEDPSTYHWVDWRFGDQVSGGDAFDEHRYWDNVSYKALT